MFPVLAAVIMFCVLSAVILSAVIMFPVLPAVFLVLLE